MEKRSIPFKNYVIFSILAILSFVFVFNMSKWYREANQYNTVLNKTILEVLPSDLENYLIENGNIMIYVTSTTDENLKTFETELKDYLIENQLENLFVYYDYEKDVDSAFENLFNQQIIYPNIYNIKEHTLQNKLYNQKTTINIEEVINFIEINEGYEYND